MSPRILAPELKSVSLIDLPTYRKRSIIGLGLIAGVGTIASAGLYRFLDEPRTFAQIGALAVFSGGFIILFVERWLILRAVSRSLAQLGDSSHSLFSNRVFMEILDSIPDPVFVKDRQHRWVTMNQRFADMIGKPREELFLKTDYDYFPAHIADVYWQKDEEVYSTASVNENKELVPDAKGVNRIALTKKIPFRDSQGQVFLVGVVRDVTELERESERLRDSEERYRLLVDNATDMVSIHDADGRFIYVSPVCRKLLGYEPSELIGKSAYDFIPMESHPEARRSHDNILGNDDLIELAVCQFRRKDGSYLWFETTSQARRNSKDGASREIFCVSRDISERRKQEQIIREQQMLLTHSSKMSALGEMAGGIAHEINNPLAIISARASQLKRWLENGKGTPEELASGLSKIEETCLRIARIIRGLRTFARDGEGDPFVPVPVRSVVEDTLEVCQERFRSVDVELRTAFDSESKVRCRNVQISQVLLNLLNNSLDAVRGLDSRWIELRIQEQSGWVQIQVTDSGSGIPVEVARQIMQPFFTTKEQGKGTGLGLSISRKIIQEHGGELFLDPESVNTRFVIRLPAASKELELPAL